MNVLLDTNVWVSALISPLGRAAQLREAWEAERFRTVASDASLNELAAVLSRPRIRSRIQVQQADIDRLLQRLRDVSIVVKPAGLLHVCRDPHDDMILETAIVGGAQYLVTRDDDIKRDLDLMRELAAHKVTVISVAAFLQVLAVE